MTIDGQDERHGARAHRAAERDGWDRFSQPVAGAIGNRRAQGDRVRRGMGAGRRLEVTVLEGTPGRPSAVVRSRGRGGGRTLLLCGHVDTVGLEDMTDARVRARQAARSLSNGERSPVSRSTMLSRRSPTCSMRAGDSIPPSRPQQLARCSCATRSRSRRRCRSSVWCAMPQSRCSSAPRSATPSAAVAAAVGAPPRPFRAAGARRAGHRKW